MLGKELIFFVYFLLEALFHLFSRQNYNSQIQADIMFNWRSFVTFLNLRNKPDAQKEIREIAAEMLNLVKTLEGNPFEHTIAAFEL